MEVVQSHVEAAQNRRLKRRYVSQEAEAVQKNPARVLVNQIAVEARLQIEIPETEAQAMHRMIRDQDHGKFKDKKFKTFINYQKILFTAIVHAQRKKMISIHEADHVPALAPTNAIILQNATKVWMIKRLQRLHSSVFQIINITHSIRN